MQHAMLSFPFVLFNHLYHSSACHYRIPVIPKCLLFTIVFSFHLQQMLHLLLTSLSNTFPKVGKRLISRGSPFLFGIQDNLALFQILGRLPLAKHSLYSHVRRLHIILAITFITSFAIQSTPTAFPFFSLLITSCTSHSSKSVIHVIV